MKTKIISVICFLMVFSIFSMYNLEAAVQGDPGEQKEATIYSTAGALALTTKWVDEYNKLNPDQTCLVSGLDDPSGINNIQSGENLLFSLDKPSGLSEEKSFVIVVGREIIVPVINLNNPFLSEITEKGITREALKQTLEGKGKMTWGELLKSDQNAPVRFVILDNDLVKGDIARYLDSEISSLKKMKTMGNEELISAIRKDPYAIGFCRLNDVLQSSSESFVNGVCLMPFDKNGSGEIEYMEQIYGGVSDFIRGAWIGKYPKELTNNLYCITGARPANEADIAFLQWVLADGQQYLAKEGLTGLIQTEKQAGLAKLAPIVASSVTKAKPVSNGVLFLIILAGLVVLGIVANMIVIRYRRKGNELRRMLSGEPVFFNEASIEVPGGLYYDKTHTWAFLEQDGSVKIGVNDFLQHVVGPVTGIELKDTGEKIDKGELLCTLIQDGKRLDLHSPVSGTIVSQNQTLVNDPGFISESPYSQGWVYRIEPANWTREIAFLSMADKYRSWLSSEFSRLKDFLATILEKNSGLSPAVVLQDGGELNDHVLKDLDPRIWEDFQAMFLNKAR